ncbi:MAG: hypothetical protein HPY55_09615 [Firmicutes bacterium]|nr:hypothetical protein [Bacillota bacterium]
MGPYGSGKTEVSINYALARLASAPCRGRHGVAIIDLDVVTPYFRTREVREELEALGLSVITPPGAVSRTDLPVIPPEARGAIENESLEVIIDVGGDPAGARAFGSLAGYARPSGLRILFVVNASRPFTRTPQEIVHYVREIEAAMGRSCTGLVSNTHLGPHTTESIVKDGRAVAAAAGRVLGLDIVLTGVPEFMEGAAPARLLVADGEILPLRLFMKPPWETAAWRMGRVLREASGLQRGEV